VKRGAKLTGCRIKSGMTIESPKQKRGGASHPKDNFIPPPDSAASAAARPRLDGCAARLLLVLSRGSAFVNIIELPKQKRSGANQHPERLNTGSR